MGPRRTSFSLIRSSISCGLKDDCIRGKDLSPPGPVDTPGASPSSNPC